MITINLKNRCSSKKSLALFMQTNITHLKELEQTRTGETYATAFNSFMRFTNGEDVSLSEMDSDMMVAYETYCKGEWGEYEYYFFLYAHTSGCIQPCRGARNYFATLSF